MLFIIVDYHRWYKFEFNLLKSYTKFIYQTAINGYLMMKNSFYNSKIDFSYISDYSLFPHSSNDKRCEIYNKSGRSMEKIVCEVGEWMSWGNGESGLR